MVQNGTLPRHCDEYVEVTKGQLEMRGEAGEEEKEGGPKTRLGNLGGA